MSVTKDVNRDQCWICTAVYSVHFAWSSLQGLSSQCKAKKIIQRGAKKGERGFCPRKGDDGEPVREPNDDEVAWPNATEVMYIILKKH